MTDQRRPRLLGLFAEPLIDGSGRSVPTLAVDEERDELAAWLEDVDVDVDFEPGSLDDFEKSFVPTVTAVHFSGHGLEEGLALEDRLGRLKLLRKDDLAAIIAAYNEGNVQLVFLSACHSETTCELVVKAGVPIVVGILRQAAVADQAARDFARAFYRQLGLGRTVRKAFDSAKAGVRARMPEEAAKFVLHHREEVNPDTVTLLGTFADGRRMQRVETAESRLVGVPHAPFFGRAKDLGAVVETLSRHRLVSVTGTGGIGKSAFAAAAARWLARRRRYRDGLVWVNLAEAGRANVLHSTVPALIGRDPVETTDQLAELLYDKDILLILDNLESLLGTRRREETRSVLERLLRAAPRLRILATTRERVGGMPEGEGWIDLGELDETAAFRLLIHHSPRPDTVLAGIDVDAASGEVRLHESLRRLLSEFHGIRSLS